MLFNILLWIMIYFKMIAEGSQNMQIKQTYIHVQNMYPCNKVHFEQALYLAHEKGQLHGVMKLYMYKMPNSL